MGCVWHSSIKHDLWDVVLKQHQAATDVQVCILNFNLISRTSCHLVFHENPCLSSDLDSFAFRELDIISGHVFKHLKQFR